MRLNAVFVLLATASMVAAQGGGGGNQGNMQNNGQNWQNGQVQGGQNMQGGQNWQGGQNQGGQGGAYVAGATTAGMNFALFIESLPKCFKKCTEDSTIATNIGCNAVYNGQNNGQNQNQNQNQNQGGGGGGGGKQNAAFTDVNCICSNPNYLSQVMSCASLDQDCAQNQFSIQQGQSAFTSFCQNNTQSDGTGSTIINTTTTGSTWPNNNRNRVPASNDAVAAQSLTVGSIVFAVAAGAAAFL